MATFPIGPVFPVNPAIFTGRNYPIPSTESALRRLAARSFDESGALDVADLVDLSEEAQAYLASFNGLDSLIAGSGQVGSDVGFVLTNEQQQRITNIVLRYKDAPFNQDTFDRIQADLRTAGLSADQLAIYDISRFANTDTTGLFLNTLNGQDTNLDTLFSQNIGSQQANADAYLKMIYNLWRASSSPLVG